MADTNPSKRGLDSGITDDTSSPEISRSQPPVYVMSQTPGDIPVNLEIILGPKPMLIDCPSCQQKVITTIIHENTKKTHCLACCICFLGGIFCAMIPYLMKAYNKVEHYCPNCNALVGFYQK